MTLRNLSQGERGQSLRAATTTLMCHTVGMSNTPGVFAAPSQEDRTTATTLLAESAEITAKTAEKCRAAGDTYSAEHWDEAARWFRKSAEVGAVAGEDYAAEAEMAWAWAEEATGINVDVPSIPIERS